MAQERTGFINLGCETETTFDTRNASLENASDVQAFDVSYDARSEPLDDSTARTTLGAYKRILGTEAGSTISFSTYAVGLQTAAGDGTTATATAQGPLYTAMFGTEQLDTGVAVHGSVPGSETAIEADVDASGDLTANGFIGVDMGSTLGIQWRPIVSVTTTTIVPALGLTTTAPVSNNIYATAFYKWKDKLAVTGTEDSCQFRFKDEEATNAMEMFGCVGSSMSISQATPGQMGVLSMEYVAASWDKDETTAPLGLTTPTPFTKSPWMDSTALVWPANEGSAVAYSANHVIKLRGLELSVSRNPQIQPDPNSTNAICGWDFPGDGTITGSLTANVQDPAAATSWHTYWEAGTAMAMMFTFGRSAGSTWGIYLPKVYFVADPTAGDENGLLTTQASFELAADRTTEPVVFQG